MSNRKLAKAIQTLSREIQRLYRNFNRALVNWLLRSVFVSQRRGQSAVAGFVLPTTVLLLLVLTLTVGAMTLRAFDRNTQVIAESQQKTIYNAATPAIDRARSKLEYLFDSSRDTRYPGGTPSEAQLLGMLTNDGVTTFDGRLVAQLPLPNGGGDPYTLPDERRLDVGSPNGVGTDGNALNDTAWRYRADTDGNGQADATVVYSIIFKTPRAVGDASAAELLYTQSDAWKAERGMVRGGPISNSSLTGCGGGSGVAGGLTPEAWFESGSDTSIIRKNFQVDALVIPDNPKSAAVTLEFQQDRQIRRGNKWGAWFRHDLEIFPGPQFNWNGAMHTEGSLILGNNNFNAYLVSAPPSCLYQKESSVISVTNIPADASTSTPRFLGLAIAGLVGGAGGSSSAAIHIHPQNSDAPTQFPRITPANDAATTGNPGEITSDPVSIVLAERTRSVNNDATNESQSAWPAFSDSVLGERIELNREKVPYVDDLYRADDRYGPKPKYKDGEPGQEDTWRIPEGRQSGDPIARGNPLINNEADPPAVGLDGYWERRARAEGLRILVGERLELGNIGGWITPRDVNGNNYIDRPNGLAIGSPAAVANLPPAPLVRATGTDQGNAVEFDGDPLYPPTVAPYPVNAGTSVPHLVQQRRSLRDNLPAVQAAAIYHAAVGDKDYPVACLASTIHPGTVDTLRQSTNFMPTSFKDGLTGTNEYLLTDFFTGRGTDGWEFTPPAGTSEAFRTAVENRDSPLRIALNNLANFAGDPDGAFPPRQETGIIHPYPALTMWGNFSNLRRALRLVDAGGGYASLSIADKTYIQTAACTLGMLAYEIDQVQKFDFTNGGNNEVWNAYPRGKVLTDLSKRMYDLIDGNVRNGEVLPKAQLSTYRYDANSADNLVDDNARRGPYNPRDYDNVPPEAYIAALKQQDIRNGFDYLNDPAIRLAEMIMLSHQIRRDRTFGFRPSPAFGEYALRFDTGSGDPVKIFPTACDPDLFALDDPILTRVRYAGAGGTRRTTPVTGMLPLVTNAAPTWQFKPIPLLTTVNDDAQLAGAVSGDLDSLAGRRLALSRLCGAIKVPPNYDPKSAPQAVPGPGGVFNFNPAARPVVMPKFPALYYVFPEVEHTLRGEFVSGGAGTQAPAQLAVADRAGEWDHRQPGAININTTNAVTAPPADRPASLLGTATALPDPAVAAGLDPYDREPYVVDNYINRPEVAGNYRFRPVSVTPPTAGRLQAYPVPAIGLPGAASVNPVDLPGAPTNRAALGSADEFFSRLPYAGSSPFPAADLPVTAVAVQPRRINGFPAGAPAAFLPNYAPHNFDADASPNRIQTPPAEPAAAAVRALNQLPTTPWAVPFLDRAMFDGRQIQVARVMDIDWGMLRQLRPDNQTGGNTEFSPNEPWLPMSGVVYAFREDAVREDGIARPAGGIVPPRDVTNAQLVTGTAMNLTNLAQPFDPAVQQPLGISIKSIDHLPDPDRRVHGFRMRNGAQLKRNPNVAGGEPAENTRGLSFFTDQPVYVQGNFNLHQAGDGSNNNFGELVEEFSQRLFGNNVPDVNVTNYTNGTFYGRTAKDDRFATLTQDRWRPTEILADGIAILSETHCDGSIADAFVNPTGAGTNTAIPAYGVDSNTAAVPSNINRALYGSRRDTIPAGLYQRGCDGNGATSFQNVSRPGRLPTANQGWLWKREGAGVIGTGWEDFTTPIQIGRLGEPLVLPRPLSKPPNAPAPLRYLPTNFDLGGLRQRYATGRTVMPSDEVDRMNAIVVSGIHPSRANQSYGGLHNFPRFVENWGGNRLIFAGSFLQLNYSNYATAPFEQEGLEPGTVGIANQENIGYYSPPNRLWGYDPALQLAPAGPAASRFVTQSPNRSEYYSEPPVTDPYINRLCVAARQALPGTTVNCPTQRPTQ